VYKNIFIHNSRDDRIYIDPVIDGLSGHNSKLIVIKNIESVLLYHNCEKQTRLMNNDADKEFKTHLSNVTWE
jgi:hypothetical protein